MKHRAIFIAILLSLTFVFSGYAQQDDFPVLKGPYLGQKPPGMTPEVFAPGIISSAEFVDFKGSFTPNGNEFYFYRLSHPSDELIPTLFFTKVENGVWTKPAQLQIAQGARTFHPCVSSDNKWLFFCWQFASGQTQRSGYYASERTDTGWSVPKYAGRGMYLTSDKSGQLYTTDSVWGNQPMHYLAKVTFSNGLFSNYERLNISAHYGKQTHPCIAPDGSYIIFDTEDEISRLFVSFKDKDGKWGEAIDLTEHGFKPNARGAYVSPDGKYLFFSNDGDIWWVDIQVIEKLRTAKGTLAYAITPPDGNAEIFLMNADGSGKIQLTSQPGRPYGPAFSPDATKIAFYNHLSDQTWSLYLMNADGTNIQRLTNVSNTLDWSADWSPDGSQIVFARSYSSPTWRSEIWVVNADGSNLHQLGNVAGQGPDWSPDGSRIVYFNYVEGGGDTWIMHADGSNPVKLTDNPTEDWWPKFSPDGSKIAFQSRRDGNHEIYMMNSDGSNPVRLTNNPADDEDPNWSPDGTKIVFISMRDGHYEIYTMNVDGSDQTRITNTNGNAIDPDWKPVVSSLNADGEWSEPRNIGPPVNRDGIGKSLVLLLGNSSLAQSQEAPGKTSPNATPPSVSVPEGNGKPVLLDGIFSPGEWDDALKISITEDVNLCLKMNSGHLFIGLKYRDPIGVLTDLWMTSNDREVYQLHSSGMLAEGVLSLPVTDQKPNYILGYAKDWDANEIKADKAKKDEWMAAGRPGGIEGQKQHLFNRDIWTRNMRYSKRTDKES